MSSDVRQLSSFEPEFIKGSAIRVLLPDSGQLCLIIEDI